MSQTTAVPTAMTRALINLVCVVAFSLAFSFPVCAQVPDSFIGSWRVERIEHNGVVLPELASQLRLEFSQTTAKLYQQSLPAITVSYTADYLTGFMSWWERKSARVQTQEGIFEFRGDKLVLCVSAIFRAVPERFETRYGDYHTLFILSRIPPVVDSQAIPEPK